MRARIAVSFATLAGLSAVIVGVACNDADSHVYSARLFEAARACLDPNAAVDVISGPGGQIHCAPVCLLNGAATYVSTMCPPYPPLFDATGRDPSCADALSAFARGDFCLTDGGSTRPQLPDAAALDGGDAAPDGSNDASADAAPEGSDDAAPDAPGAD